MIWIILGLIIGLVVAYLVASKFSEIAEMKGHEGHTYFWYTFLFGICGMLMVIALPNVKAAESKEEKRTKIDSFIHIRNEPQAHTATYTQTNNIKDVNKANPPVSAEVSNGEKVCPK